MYILIFVSFVEVWDNATANILIQNKEIQLVRLIFMCEMVI